MITLGIDISKAKIDVWDGQRLTIIDNNEDALRHAFKRFEGKDARAVMEATGRYHRIAHRVLSELGMAVMVLNPFQSRHFAKAMHVLCKTDKVDAKVLAMYGEKMDFKTTVIMTEDEQTLQNLIRHLDDLKAMKVRLSVQCKEAGAFEAASFERLKKALHTEIEMCEQEAELLVMLHKEMESKRHILTSIPGVGKMTALMLVGLLRELGSLSRSQLGALAGVAPMNFDSGSFNGKRRIQKGRHDVRRHLYMPILGDVTRHNPVLKAFYERLL